MVAADWIESVLNRSLHHAALIALGLQEQPDALENPWKLVVQETNLPSHPLPPGTSIIQVYDEADGEPEEDLPRFEYARAVFMETLRLYPASFGLIRQATQDDIIAGHEVKAGTVICMAPYFTHRHPSFWTDPEHFDPERFLPGGTKPHHKYAYLPFGGGPHICMGNQFALVEALVIMAPIALPHQNLPLSVF